MDLGQYKNIFGEARLGIHKYRVFDRPIIDWIVTLLFVFLLSHLLKLSFFYAFLIAMVIMVIVHLSVNADTVFETYLKRLFKLHIQTIQNLLQKGF